MNEIISEQIDSNPKKNSPSQQVIKKTSGNLLHTLDNSTLNSFEKAAKNYDEDPFTEFLFSAENKKVLELLNILDGDNVLDLGCGTGKYIRLFEKHTGVKITGSDISEEMIQQSKQNNPNINIKYQVTNIERRLPFPDNSFDKINCAHVLKFILTQDGLNHTFQEIARILKPGGTFVFSNNHPDRDFEWEDFDLKRKNEETQDDEEIKMVLHKIDNYTKACKYAGLKIEYKSNIVIDNNNDNLLKENSFEKIKGCQIIIALKITKQ